MARATGGRLQGIGSEFDLEARKPLTDAMVSGVPIPPMKTTLSYPAG